MGMQFGGLRTSTSEPTSLVAPCRQELALTNEGGGAAAGDFTRGKDVTRLFLRVLPENVNPIFSSFFEPMVKAILAAKRASFSIAQGMRGKILPWSCAFGILLANEGGRNCWTKGRKLMGWAFCGTDDNGREIGYGVVATCDFPGCQEKIDRGLGYLCGEMHNPSEWGCGKYYCDKHLDQLIHDCPYPQFSDEE